MIDLNTQEIGELNIETNYCIPQDLHDSQVLANIAKGYSPIEPPRETNYNPIAVVCSGPTLAATWREVKKFPVILTCSGAHNFLIEKGIIPTYHAEADPRQHKCEFVKTPHKDVEYLIASCCHADLFRALVEYKLRIWHVLGRGTERELPSVYPPGHHVVTGGSNVGLRCLVLARMLGHSIIHVFGMDCSSDKRAFHIGDHPNEPKSSGLQEVKLGDKTFVTTQVFLFYANQFFHEIEQLPDCQFFMHGDGLLQNLAIKKFGCIEAIKSKRRELATKGSSTISYQMPRLISNEYVEQNRKLHEQRADYGISGARYADMVMKLKKATQAESVLDYGAGKQLLAKALPFPIWCYDPAVPGIDQPARPSELVISTDVLEHIEPDFIDAVLTDLARVTIKVGYFVINTAPAKKTLPDGRNTHLIQQGEVWWKRQLDRFFTVASIQAKGPLLHVVVSPKIKL